MMRTFFCLLFSTYQKPRSMRLHDTCYFSYRAEHVSTNNTVLPTVKSVIASLVSANNGTLQDPFAYVFTMDGCLLHNSCADILHSSCIRLTLTLWNSILQTFTLTQSCKALRGYSYHHNHHPIPALSSSSS